MVFKDFLNYKKVCKMRGKVCKEYAVLLIKKNPITNIGWELYKSIFNYFFTLSKPLLHQQFLKFH